MIGDRDCIAMTAIAAAAAVAFDTGARVAAKADLSNDVREVVARALGE